MNDDPCCECCVINDKVVDALSGVSFAQEAAYETAGRIAEEVIALRRVNEELGGKAFEGHNSYDHTP